MMTSFPWWWGHSWWWCRVVVVRRVRVRVKVSVRPRGVRVRACCGEGSKSEDLGVEEVVFKSEWVLDGQGICDGMLW